MAKSSQKFLRFSKSLDRLVRARQAERDARQRVREQLERDQALLVTREKRRAYLAGSWLLAHRAEWFRDPVQQRDFLAWLGEVPSRASDARLFAEGADDDLLTPDVVESLSEKVGAGDLFGGGEGASAALDLPPQQAADEDAGKVAGSSAGATGED